MADPWFAQLGCGPAFKRDKSEEKTPLARPARLPRECGPAGNHLELAGMRSRKDYITYCEWRERGETALGAALQQSGRLP